MSIPRESQKVTHKPTLSASRVFQVDSDDGAQERDISLIKRSALMCLLEGGAPLLEPVRLLKASRAADCCSLFHRLGLKTSVTRLQFRTRRIVIQVL